MVKVQADPKKELRKTLKEAQKKLADLTIPLTLIAQSWFKSNRAIFTLKGPGKYVDFRSMAYRMWKRNHLGSEYPMMKLTGRIEKSITDPQASESINLILNKKHLVLGTSVPYANIHAQGAPSINLAKRPVVLFGNESVAPNELNTRVESWKMMMLKYCADVTGAK